MADEKIMRGANHQIVRVLRGKCYMVIIFGGKVR